ncbi:hypothetical protein RKD27_002551 [Streptomyces sp. SAI-126]|uniref:hypothetical protein n=1 Tax=Streptomyces sp. SAI-126 TaxID=3377732 RepID=UPI003C79F645
MTSAHDPHTTEAQADTASTGTELGSGPTAFRFQVQPEFHAIPLATGGAEEEFDEQMRKFARDYWGEHEQLEPIRRFTAAMYGVNSQQLTADGTVYHALGVFPIGGTADGSLPPERVSRCTLTVSVRDIGNPDPHLVVAGIAETLDQGKGSGEVQMITLSAGPAVLHIAGSRAVWGLSDGEEQERFFVRVEIWMPFPAEDRLLLVCLSTADVQDLFHYQAVLADIADTITFGDAEADVDLGANASDSRPLLFG